MRNRDRLVERGEAHFAQRIQPQDFGAGQIGHAGDSTHGHVAEKLFPDLGPDVGACVCLQPGCSEGGGDGLGP